MSWGCRTSWIKSIFRLLEESVCRCDIIILIAWRRYSHFYLQVSRCCLWFDCYRQIIQYWHLTNGAREKKMTHTYQPIEINTSSGAYKCSIDPGFYSNSWLILFNPEFSVKSGLFYGNDHFRTSPKQKLWRIKIQSTQTSSSFLKRMCSTCSVSAEPPCGACGPNETSLAIASREPRGFIASERTFLTQ